MSDWHDCPQPGPSPEEVLEEARGQAFEAGRKAGLAEAEARFKAYLHNWIDLTGRVVKVEATLDQSLEAFGEAVDGFSLDEGNNQ